MNRDRANEVATKCGLDAVASQELAEIQQRGISYEEYANELREGLEKTNPDWELGDDFDEAIVYYLEHLS